MTFKIPEGENLLEEITYITINNWEKFNYRKDITNASWFRLNHDLFENPDLYHFTHSDLSFWIYLLCLASRKSKADIVLSFSRAKTIGRFKEAEIKSALNKLQELRMVHVDVTSAGTNVTSTGATQHNKQTIHNNTEHPILDFDQIYQKYPRKLGKQKGIEKCKAQIHTGEDFQSLSQAVDKYCTFLSSNNTDAKFIKHFDTFMTSWQDWLSPDVGQAPAQKFKGIEEVLAELEEKEKQFYANQRI